MLFSGGNGYTYSVFIGSLENEDKNWVFDRNMHLHIIFNFIYHLYMAYILNYVILFVKIYIMYCLH